MARLLAHLHAEPLVDHGAFDLVDDAGPQSPAPAAADRWLHITDNAVTALSASGEPHYAAVTIESWEGEPPAQPPQAWEARHDGALALASGDVELNPLVDGAESASLQIGPPGTYHLRAYVTGRQAIADTSDFLPRGIERYLFQFWR